MTNRRINFSRLLDRVAGSALAVTKTKVEKGKLVKDLDASKLADSKYFRTLVDQYLPALYLVDLNVVAKEIYSGLLNNSSRYVNAITTSQGMVFEEDKEFADEYIKFIQQNSTLINTALVSILKEALLTEMQQKRFKPIIDSLDTIYNRGLAELSKSKAYVGFRNSAARMQRDVRNTLQVERTFIATDASDMLDLPSINSMLVVAPSFNRATKDVNDILTKACKNFLEDKVGFKFKGFDNITKEGFFIGSFINSGHTAAFGSKGEVIGVNMPSALKAQFLLGNNITKSYEIEESLATLYAEVGYTLTFTQNFTESARTLLDLGFAFTITMPSELNTNKLRPEEARRIKELIANEVLPDIVEQAKRKFAGGLVDLLPEVSASPSIVDIIEQRVVAQIEGKRFKPYKKTSSVSTSTELGIKALKKTGSTTKQKAKVNKTSVSIKVAPATAPTAAVRNIDLLSLINNSLAEQIRKNMGTGLSKNVLNYRTGRLAESAKLVKVSTSRQGLVTAFYTYMKNPYATFSAGGRQQYPRSRDPKLLISKSIRELATAAAISNLRVVNV